MSLELPLAVEEGARDTALKMVGGVDGISRAVAGEVPLILDYGPEEDESGQSVTGEVSTTGQARYLVALRVSRRRREVVDGEVLGRVRARCNFWNSLADFRVEDSNAPPQFSRTSSKRDLETSYKYSEWPDTRRTAGSGSALRVRHGDPVPREPTPTAQLARSSLDDERVERQLEAIVDLFSRRPVWRRKRLAEELAHMIETPENGLNGAELSQVLPMVAFEVVTGPWRRTWVRFGHDVRNEPRSRFLQVVDTSKGLAKDLSTSKQQPQQRPQAATIQLCDLESRAAQDLVLNAPRTQDCDPHTGWFTRSLLDDLVRTLTNPATDSAQTTEDPKQHLTWREFVDVAAVADLNTTVIATSNDAASSSTTNSRKRRRTSSKQQQQQTEQSGQVDEDEEEEEEEGDEDEDEEETSQGDGGAAVFPTIDKLCDAAFTILEEDDKDDDDDDDD